MTQYPEHEKLKIIKENSQQIGEFLDWLFGKATICLWHERHECFYPAGKTIEGWLAEYFGIDQTKIDEEKRQMLEEIRSQQ